MSIAQSNKILHSLLNATEDGKPSKGRLGAIGRRPYRSTEPTIMYKGNTAYVSYGAVDRAYARMQGFNALAYAWVSYSNERNIFVMNMLGKDSVYRLYR